LDKRLGSRVFKNVARGRKDTKKWQYGTDADDLSKRDKNHQNEQKPELSSSPTADAMPESAKKREDWLGKVHGSYLLSIIIMAKWARYKEWPFLQKPTQNLSKSTF
jgi:hypothetical protein